MAADIDHDELTLIVAGQAISGWQDVSLTLACEQIPNHFDIKLTEHYPGEIDLAVVARGDPCQVKLGADVVLTGYIDRYSTIGTPDNMQVRIVGRGKTCDLVDCSAEWPGGQISGSNAAEIVTKLCAAYGITVRQVGDPGPVIPQFNFMLGETPFELIEHVCRYAGLLFYENAEGELVLSRIGEATAASGIAEGVNVKRAQVDFEHDQRFSEYHVFMMATQVLGDVGQGGNQLAVEKDAGVKRNRKRYIVAEAPSGGQDITKRRAIWERNRRAGRGTSIDAEIDSWRDLDGKLWAPNTILPVNLPSWRQPGLRRVLSRATFERDAQGTRARILLMPKAAFSIEPIQLLPVFTDIE
jgi:prophage tail gpP-like protein